jgi:hypothetical protein
MMLRVFLAAMIALPIVASRAEAPKPDPKAVAHVAKACTKDGAFGRPFGEAGYGHVDAIADDEWAPFRRLTIGAARGDGMIISAEASFHDAGDSREDDIALARVFFKALDKAITAKHRFPHREANGNGVTFHTSKEPDAGLVFDIHREADRVIADCVDLGEEPSRQHEQSRPEPPDDR